MDFQSCVIYIKKNIEDRDNHDDTRKMAFRNIISA